MLVNNTKPDLLALLETKSPSVKARGIFSSLGFGNFVICEGRGLTGGIWVVWKGDVNSVSIIQKSFQYLHLKILDR